MISRRPMLRVIVGVGVITAMTRRFLKEGPVVRNVLRIATRIGVGS